MSDPSDQLEVAVGHHQAGRFQAAEKLYRQIVESDPKNAEAWHLLGILTSQLGDPKKAIGYIERATEIDPNNSAYLGNLGVVYQSAKEINKAIVSYRRALEGMPDFTETHNNLGNALRESGQLDQAANHLRRAIQIKPDYAEAHYNLGITLRAQQDLEAAISSLRRAIEIRPNYLKAQVNLASAFKEHGDFELAISTYKRAIDLDPNNADIINEAGICFHDQGDLQNASKCYRRAAQLRPEFAEAHNNLGTTLQDLGMTDPAAASYRRALQIDHSIANTHTNLGNVLQEGKRWDEAVVSYQQALSIDPDSIQALCQLVHLKKHLCDWDNLDALSAQVIAAVDRGSGGIPPFTFINLPDTTPAQHLNCAKQFVRDKSSIATCRRTNLGFSFSRDAKEILTVGYVSADFREHAMSSLFAELFGLHDRSRFRVIGYSHGPDDGSPTRTRILRSFDKVVDIQNDSHVQAARKIYDDGVDILIDLIGHQNHARNEIFALRPAPIQVNYLAYPGTTGTDFMDYILVDEFSVPRSHQLFFTEKLVHLPDCYQVNDSQRKISETTPTRSECGLPETGFVFCSFNQTYKIIPGMFDIWMRLLTRVEGSVLWLWASNPCAATNLQREAEIRGVAPSRLIFAPRAEMPDHLARYRLADLVLDTFPYNGHTTTSDALWAGCPVLTLAGETFPSRVAGSLLAAIKAPELITYSMSDYENLGLALASDGSVLSKLRSRIAANRKTTALFDTRKFTRNLEAAFEKMWVSHLKNPS